MPGKPQITNTDTTIDSEFTLTWSRPSYDGGDDIIKYKVEWRKKPISDATTADEKENIGETQLRVEGLEGGEEYEFKVFAKNRAEGISEPDIKSFKVKKSEGKCHVTFEGSNFQASIFISFSEFSDCSLSSIFPIICPVLYCLSWQVISVYYFPCTPVIPLYIHMHVLYSVKMWLYRKQVLLALDK